MKKLTYLLSSLLLAGIFLASCSSDDNNSNPTQEKKKFFDMKAGSYWVYDDYEYNENNEKKLETHTLDSVAVTGSSTLYEKTAFKLETFLMADNAAAYEKDGESQYAFDENKLWVSSDFFDIGDNLPIPIQYDFPTNQWFLIADRSVEAGTVWNVIPSAIEIKGIDISDMFPMGGTADISFLIKAKRNATGTATINNKTYNTESFDLITSVTFVIKLDIPLVPPITSQADIVVTSTYADGIGLIKRESKSTTISFSSYYTEKIEGWVSDIKTFKVD